MSNASWIVLIEFVCLQLFLLFSEFAFFSVVFPSIRNCWSECFFFFFLFCFSLSVSHSQHCALLFWDYYSLGCVVCVYVVYALVLFVVCLLSIFRQCNHWERRTNVLLLMKLIGTLTGCCFFVFDVFGRWFCLVVVVAFFLPPLLF